MKDITIAILADDRCLGLRCAKNEYGIDTINKVLEGYLYQGYDGGLITRLGRGEVYEDDPCEECQLALFICNAYEVSE